MVLFWSENPETHWTLGHVPGGKSSSFQVVPVFSAINKILGEMIVKIPGWRWESLYCLVAAATVLMIRMAASLPHAQVIDLGCLYLSVPSFCPSSLLSLFSSLSSFLLICM